MSDCDISEDQPTIKIASDDGQTTMLPAHHNYRVTPGQPPPTSTYSETMVDFTLRGVELTVPTSTMQSVQFNLMLLALAQENPKVDAVMLQCRMSMAIPRKDGTGWWAWPPEGTKPPTSVDDDATLDEVLDGIINTKSPISRWGRFKLLAEGYPATALILWVAMWVTFLALYVVWRGR